VDLGSGTGGWTQLLLQERASHITAIDRTLLDKKLQKNTKVTYVHEKAENVPKLKIKPDFIVMDINVNPAHAQKIFLNFDKKNPGSTSAILTQKILQGKDLATIPKVGEKLGKWKVVHVGNTWFARRECYMGLEKKIKDRSLT
jgi:predicted rRNA methylase YqxC with S4 and FtsJ domains